MFANNETPETTVIKKQSEELAFKILKKAGLNDRQMYVLLHRMELFGAEHETLQKIGDKYGISKERVRQIEAKAKRLLKARAARVSNPLEKNCYKTFFQDFKITEEKTVLPVNHKLARLNERLRKEPDPYRRYELTLQIERERKQNGTT